MSLLAGITDIKSIGIGLEKNISAADYPIIRLVPSRTASDGQFTSLDFIVYFGDNLTKIDMEAAYLANYTWEAEIRQRLEWQTLSIDGAMYGIRFVDNLADEDRFENYKISASRFTVSAV